MIKHISYYKDGERHIVKPNSKGRFSIVIGSGAYGKPQFADLTAKEFIEHAFIKDHDPTITLMDGNKVRVYHAGNSNIPIVYPSLIADQYDRQARESRKASLEKKLNKLKKQKDEQEKRKEQTTQPMAPIAPPYPGKRTVKVSNSPPVKKDPADDPFGPLIDSWFGTDEDDPNDGLYDDYEYGYDDGND